MTYNKTKLFCLRQRLRKLKLAIKVSFEATTTVEVCDATQVKLVIE